MKIYKTDLGTAKLTKKRLFRTSNFEAKTAKSYGTIKLDNFYDKKTTEAIMRNIIPIENKLILANKRITKLKSSIVLLGEIIKVQTSENIKHINESDIFRDSMTKKIKLWDVANLKQKKAWIAFYIATIIYIVGIIIFIWK